MTRVLLAKEKHEDRILAADTDEELARSSLKLLLERWEEGWYEDPDEYWEYREEPPYTQEQIEGLPEGSGARREAEHQNERWLRYEHERKQNRQFWAFLQGVIEYKDDPEILTKTSQLFTGRIGKKDPSKPFGKDNFVSPYEQFPSLYVGLEFRKDFEYEWVELQEIES